MSLFIHLRAYSDYSLGMSNLKLKQIIMRCHDFDMPAICVSDRNMFGTLEFAIGAAASGIQPIIGFSVDIDYGTIISLLSGKVEKNYNLNEHVGEALLIVKSEFPSDIETMFGRKYLSLLKEWFESVYKLPVNTIEERI